MSLLDSGPQYEPILVFMEERSPMKTETLVLARLPRVFRLRPGSSSQASQVLLPDELSRT
jgi:hypothetical protein